MSKKMKPQQYMEITDASKQWKLPSDKIKQLCEEGKIAGISKLGDDWIIPVDTEKPVIKRKMFPNVIPQNEVQKAALENIEEGVPFDVNEYEIDGRTFIVSSVFRRQGQTLEEILLSLMIGDIESEAKAFIPVESIEKAKKEIRKISVAANATFEDYINSYRIKLQSYGFSEDDIEVLLEKITADYEPFEL